MLDDGRVAEVVKSSIIKDWMWVQPIPRPAEWYLVSVHKQALDPLLAELHRQGRQRG